MSVRRPREPGLDAALWAATAPPPLRAPPLVGELQADVVVVGAGITGASAALHLAERGVRVLALEAREVGWGASGRNIGHVLPGLWIDPDTIERRLGPEYGPRLVAALGAAPAGVYALIARHGIECDLVRKGVVRAADSERGLRGLRSQAAQWQRRGAPVELVDRDRAAALLGTERYRGAMIEHRSATIQPLSYVRGLARAAIAAGADLHEGTPVTRLARRDGRWRVETPGGAVAAEAVVLATNTYSDELWPGIRPSLIPGGCFAYATQPLGENVARTVLPAGHPMYDTQPVMTFARKDRDDRLILGSLGYLPRRGAGAWADRVVGRLFPQLGDLAWSFRWAGSLGFTTEDLPRLHEPAPGLHVILGYNGRGIAQGTFWGRVLAARLADPEGTELPLPVTPVRPVRGRRLWMLAFDAAFRAYRLRSLLD